MEAYKVALHGTQAAQLPQLAFDGASKRNKPALVSGDVVFCRVVTATPFCEPELSCAVASGPAKDWVTGESLYGQLKGGLLTPCSIQLAHRYVMPSKLRRVSVSFDS